LCYIIAVNARYISSNIVLYAIAMGILFTSPLCYVNADESKSYKSYSYDPYDKSFSFKSISKTDYQHPENLNETAQVRDKNQTCWSLIMSNAIAICTMLIAAAAIIQLFIMRNTAKRQLRAYVGISGISGQPQGAETIEVTIKFKNFGQTPAYNLKSFIDDRVARHPLNEKLKDASYGKDSSKVAVFPQTEYIVHRTVHTNLRLLKEDFGKALFIYGEVIYEDAFGNRRWTRYRSYLQERGNPLPVVMFVANEVLFTIDSEGNEAN
jgi:hypothetical protein